MNTLSTYLPILVGILLPIVVGYSTKTSTPSQVKAALHVALAIVVGPLVAWQAAKFSGGFDVLAALESSAVVYAAGVVAHYGFLVPTGVSATLARIGNADPPLAFDQGPAFVDTPVQDAPDAPVAVPAPTAPPVVS